MRNQNKRSVSLISWLSGIKKYQKKISGCVDYNNKKAQRLKKLNELINLPSNKIYYIDGKNFQIEDLKLKSVIKNLGGHKKLYAFRISPKEKYINSINIIKKFGLTFDKFFDYISSLNIDLEKTIIRITEYRGLLKYAAIVIANNDGIVGEIIQKRDYILIYKLKHQEGVNITPFF